MPPCSSSLAPATAGDVALQCPWGTATISSTYPSTETGQLQKYRPDFPVRFDSILHSRSFGRPFFHWYNHIHRHSGIGLLTPATVHYGRAAEVRQRRTRVLEAAYAANPDRFVRGLPQPPKLPTAVWINSPQPQEDAH